MRIIVMITVFLVIGVIALPSTISLFAGQHLWYGIDAYGNDVPCVKCHADVEDELRLSGHHSALYCEDCHRGMSINYSSGYRDGSVYDPYSIPLDDGWGAHAASTMACLYCHSGFGDNADPGQLGNYHAHIELTGNCKRCHFPSAGDPPPVAGGFGVTGNPQDYGNLSAHRPFVLESMNSSVLYHANEACIACHTQVTLVFNYTAISGMSVVVNNTYTSANSLWQVESSSPLTTIYRVSSTDRTAKGSYEVVG